MAPKERCGRCSLLSRRQPSITARAQSRERMPTRSALWRAYRKYSVDLRIRDIGKSAEHRLLQRAIKSTASEASDHSARLQQASLRHAGVDLIDLAGFLNLGGREFAPRRVGVFETLDVHGSNVRSKKALRTVSASGGARPGGIARLLECRPTGGSGHPLHRFGHRPLEGRDNPLVPDSGAVRPRPSVREGVGDLEDRERPSDGVTRP